MNQEHQLIQIRENASSQLAQIKDIETGVDFIDKLKAIETYAKATRQDSEIIKQVQENKIRGMRIVGQLLKETELEAPNATGKNQYKKEVELPEETQPKPRLSDFGLSKKESHTYQVIADIPEQEFNEKMEEVKSDDSTVNEITVSEFYSTGKSIRKINDNQENKLADSIIDTPFVQPYGEGFYFKGVPFNENRFDDHIITNNNKLPTVTTWCRFYHKDTMLEWSFREYARAQTFPDDYAFVGTYATIKKQIGNAVAPKMGEYITRQLKGKTVGDLFAGCGGFSCGAHFNKKVTLWAVEWEELPAIAYKMNFPDTTVYQTNIKALNPANFEPVDIIIGGPPCQGFSNAGPRFKDDPRNELYKEFLRFVAHIKPGEFIMENVPQIQDIKEQIISDFNDVGYTVRTELVNGNSIGMAQDRKRFFFIGKKRIDD